ncbi:hypothetical protein WICMUC_000542 [Wickerhamomyces mucosus]|uniref:Uncharacterized protein n=1 Tax=Wickerhamomyces mucosus TaxID=1378264 RepID=A0A9P8PXG0_9ASCO|nr:hypothetical protein WICMUC_000542 [Wickerhamomyces mucosus]
MIEISGHRLVGINCSSEPGESDFRKPETKIVRTTPIVEAIPNKLIKDRMFNGKNEGGVRTRNAKILKWFIGISGNIAFKLSANKTIKATPEASKSNENKTEMNARPRGPNATNAKSEYVINVGSVSMQRLKRPAAL